MDSKPLYEDNGKLEKIPRLYVAYGINTNDYNMNVLCPDAKKLGRVCILNHRLAYRNGFLTILPFKGRNVECLLWSITPKCEQSLDEYEGVPRFYDKKTTTIATKSGYFDALVYVMSPEHLHVLDAPSPSYEKRVKKGYKRNGMSILPLRRAFFELNQERAGFSWSSIQALEKAFDSAQDAKAKKDSGRDKLAVLRSSRKDHTAQKPKTIENLPSKKPNKTTVI